MSIRPRPPGRSRRTIVIVVVLLFLFGSTFLSRFYTDVLWFQEVGFAQVLWKTLTTQFLFGLGSAVIVGLFLWLNAWFAARSAPVYVPRRGDPLDEYRLLLGPHVRKIRIAVALVLGLFFGLYASSLWQDYLLWVNRTTVGEVDPQFGKDIGFYLFELPFLDALTGEVWSALFLALLVAAAAHVFHGAIRVEGRRPEIARSALAHLSVLLGLLALTKAAQYVLGTYKLNFSERGVVTGASYTDVHAQLPALRLLAAISVLSAVLFLVNIVVRRLALPVFAVVVWLLIAVLAGGLWPAVTQRFSVEPQEPTREAPYIDRNIAATRRAFGLSDVKTMSYPARSSLTAEQLDEEENKPLLDNVRLWDPDVLQQAYSQLQAIRLYYSFEDVEVDRYEIDGETRQVLLSPRELSISDLPPTSQKWSNIHLQYTHGYGIVASLANASTTAGQPSFLVKDIPGTVLEGAESLELDEPRIYYGESLATDDYSIVGSRQEELDFESDEGVERSSYDGEGGIELSGLLRKLAFAVREGDPNFVLSGLITPESRVLIYRNVRERLLRAAPFLSIDSDPYATVVDGRLVWVLDAYTTSSHYPYSQRLDSSEAEIPQVPGSLSGDFNYIRNSVKATIDAYDGTIKLYVIDEDDPVIRVWRQAFPDLFTDEEPAEELVGHFRYPEDLFKVQSFVYGSYHIDDADDFYGRQDEWAIAEHAELTNGQVQTSGSIAPTYLLTRLPGETGTEFVLTRPYTPRARKNMVSFLVARSDPENYGEIVSLEFPRQVQVSGPVQIDNLINQDVEIARELTLLGQRGSVTEFGSLVVLPIEESILYIQPLFVRAEGASGGIPELKKVFMVLGEEVVMEDTFEAALNALLGAPEPPVVEPPDEEPDPGEKRPPSKVDDRVLQQAAELYERAQRALQQGDLERYARLIEQLGGLLQRATVSR